MKCSVANCTRRVRSNGLCGAHYYRQRRHGDPLGGAPSRQPFPAMTKEQLAALYDQADSVSAMARQLGVNRGTLNYQLSRNGIIVRTTGYHSHWSSPGKRMQESPNWRGGRHITSKGYVRIYAPDHPTHNSKGYVMEQRLVMEQMLGRPLLRTEHVHHLNGIRDDNRPANLELWKRKDPTGVRPHQDQHCPTCTCFIIYLSCVA